MTWDFQQTGFVQMWNTLMQWRYVRIAAFAWVVLGMERGWTIAADAFRPMVVVVVACLALVALADASLIGYRLHRARGIKEDSK